MKENELLFGAKAVIESLNAGRQIDKVMIRRDMPAEQTEELHAALRNWPTVQVQRVPVERLNFITKKNHGGVIAFISKVEYQKLSAIIPAVFENGKDPMVVAVDGVTDVRNFGSIARTAECAGADALVTPIRGGVIVNGDAMRTSAGALQHIPVCKERSMSEAIHFMRNSGLKVVAVTKGAKKSYAAVDYTGPVAVVFADDSLDVSGETLRSADVVVSVPCHGTVENVNVSVAVGIVLYEALRQRNSKQ